MIIYEVNLIIEKETVSSFIKWLELHIEKMLEFKGFCSANLLRELEETYSVQYCVDSMDDLNHYFEKYSEKMRNEGLALFENKFKASRRIIEVLKKY